MSLGRIASLMAAPLPHRVAGTRFHGLGVAHAGPLKTSGVSPAKSDQAVVGKPIAGRDLAGGKFPLPDLS